MIYFYFNSKRIFFSSNLVFALKKLRSIKHDEREEEERKNKKNCPQKFINKHRENL